MDEDGSYDELDVYKLAEVEQLGYRAELKYLERLMLMKVNNCREPHILRNGERAAYSTASGKP